MEVEMKVVKMSEVSEEPLGEAPMHTGPVTEQVLVPDCKDNIINIVNFSKGVRNKLHTHTFDQVMIVTAGEGIVATEQEERAVTVGDVILIPAGEKHWHGATKDLKFSHLFVLRRGNSTTICSP